MGVFLHFSLRLAEESQCSLQLENHAGDNLPKILVLGVTVIDEFAFVGKPHMVSVNVGFDVFQGRIDLFSQSRYQHDIVFLYLHDARDGDVEEFLIAHVVHIQHAYSLVVEFIDVFIVCLYQLEPQAA